jgi:hypothetical protein
MWQAAANRLSEEFYIFLSVQDFFLRNRWSDPEDIWHFDS